MNECVNCERSAIEAMAAPGHKVRECYERIRLAVEKLKGAGYPESRTSKYFETQERFLGFGGSKSVERPGQRYWMVGSYLWTWTTFDRDASSNHEEKCETLVAENGFIYRNGDNGLAKGYAPGSMSWDTQLQALPIIADYLEELARKYNT
jgi:hypothetical protein